MERGRAIWDGCEWNNMKCLSPAERSPCYLLLGLRSLLRWLAGCLTSWLYSPLLVGAPDAYAILWRKQEQQHFSISSEAKFRWWHKIILMAKRKHWVCVSVFEFWAGRMDVKGLRWRSLIARHVILQRLVVCFITHHKILWRDDGEMVPALILFHCFYGSSSDDNDVQGSCLCYIYYIISGMWMFLRLSGLGWPRSYQPIILLVITL